jgi:hypothetical protein
VGLFQYFLSVSDEASEGEDAIFLTNSILLSLYNILRYTEENETAYGGRGDSVMYEKLSKLGGQINLPLNSY